MNQEEEKVLAFIVQNSKYVHPNTLKLMEKRDEENIMMALNQIHYGTLKVKREVGELRSATLEDCHNLNAKED